MTLFRSLALVIFVAPASARADDRLVDDDTFAVSSRGALAVDAGLFLATPSALPSGISTGLAVGLTRACGCHLAYGVRATWSSITESSGVYTVTQDDYRLRLTGEVRHEVGRGSVAVRLGIGPTFVHEVRVLDQGMRSGRTDLDRRAWGTVPAADLDARFAIHVAGPWLGIASAGPSLDHSGGAFAWGWNATLGVAWQP
ncbi:hypothetical protein BH11MYX1_BH11MYX1_04580 [soil metagenome]